jgi:hypothetical protein
MPLQQHNRHCAAHCGASALVKAYSVNVSYLSDHCEPIKSTKEHGMSPEPHLLSCRATAGLAEEQNQYAASPLATEPGYHICWPA